MTDGLVDLQRNLVPVEHDGHYATRAPVSAQECSRLLGDAGRLTGEVEPVDVLPTALAARAGLRARIAPHLEETVTSCGAFDPRAALISSCSTSVPSEVSKELVLALRAHHRLPDEDFRAEPSLVGFEALRHLLRDRNIEWVARPTCGVAWELWERVVANASSAREGAGSEGRVACAVLRKADGRANPQAPLRSTRTPILALRIGEEFDASALRRHELVSLHHDACVRVLSARSGRPHRPRLHIGPHARDSNQAARTLRSGRGYNAPAFKRWWRNW